MKQLEKILIVDYMLKQVRVMLDIIQKFRQLGKYDVGCMTGQIEYLFTKIVCKNCGLIYLLIQKVNHHIFNYLGKERWLSYHVLVK